MSDNILDNVEEKLLEMSDSGTRTPRLKVLAIAAVVVTGFAWVALRDDEGVRHVFRERSRLHEISQSVDSLRAENDHLRAEIKALREDPRAVERIAREELGLSKKDEVVFIIESEPAPANR